MENVICEFCGQVLMCDQELTDEEKTVYARKNCTCDTAKAYSKITGLFGKDTDKHYALDSRIMKALYSIADLVNDNLIASGTLKINSELKASINSTPKDKLVIKREDKETAQETV